MAHTGDDEQIPDYGPPFDGSDVQDFPDLDYLGNTNLFAMDMDKVYEEVTSESPPPESIQAEVASDDEPLRTILTENVSESIDLFGESDTSMAESYNQSQSNDPSPYPYSSPAHPYSQSVRSQILPPTFANPTQTFIMPTLARQGNTELVSHHQPKNRSSTDDVCNPQEWTDMLKTNLYSSWLGLNSPARGHFGVNGYTLPDPIDSTFLYIGKGYTKGAEDDAAEDLALSDIYKQKSQSAQPRYEVGRSLNVQSPSIPHRASPFNTWASPSFSPQVSEQDKEYPWAKPHRPASTNLSRPTARTRAQTYGRAATNFDEPMIQAWDNLYQGRSRETGLHSANPYFTNPSQDNQYQENIYSDNPYQSKLYQINNDIEDNLDREIFPPITTPPQNTSRTTTSAASTNIRRPSSKIPVPIRRDTTRIDPRRRRAQTTSQIGESKKTIGKKDPRGRALPTNRIGSKMNLDGNNRRADNALAPGTYDRLPAPPQSWTSTNGKKYVYDISGELQNGTYYTVGEIEDFLYQNPRRADMTIWLQRLPADSAARYPYSESRRCRFLHCFMSNGTINQGHYRIAFDELTSTHDYHDPMHNAGYVHLYCFEKFLDFPKVVYDLNVQVDQRDLPLEPRRKMGLLYRTSNRMMFSTRGELNVATEFLDYCVQYGQGPPGYPHYSTRNTPPAAGKMGHENTLVHRLWQMKIRHDAGTITSAQTRGAKASTGVSHMGNLEIETYERAQTRKRENQVIRKGISQQGEKRAESPETSARAERAKKRQKLREEQQLATSLRDLQDDDDEVEDYDDEADADGDKDSLFGE
ncbi:hypothetical protein MMC26_004234 [Xylographa opegraphella]|nr:hypothetical protein [Xylographa opegraphella]